LHVLDSWTRQCFAGGVPAADAEYVGPLLLHHGPGRSWEVTGEFRCIEPRVVDDDGRGHIVLWWGRVRGPDEWGDDELLNCEVDLEFRELPLARGLVIRRERHLVGYKRWSTQAWMYGLDGAPWYSDAAGGGLAGVREPRTPMPDTPAADLLLDPDDLL
jgi:hypothetical protein